MEKITSRGASEGFSSLYSIAPTGRPDKSGSLGIKGLKPMTSTFTGNLVANKRMLQKGKFEENSASSNRGKP